MVKRGFWKYNRNETKRAATLSDKLHWARDKQLTNEHVVEWNDCGWMNMHATVVDCSTQQRITVVQRTALGREVNSSRN